MAWVGRFVRFCGMRHPRVLGAADVTRFLSSLAVDREVSASTQNQALSALVFLYRQVLDAPVGWLAALVRAKRPARVPVVLTRDEVRRVLARLKGRGAVALIAGLLYGSGLRLLEVLQLRAKDLDFATNEIRVRGGKGDRDRVTMLPERLKGPLLHHLAEVRARHERDVAEGAGWVELPGALGTKYPQAGREWGWQWVFPASRTYDDPRTGQRRRHHLHETVVQRAFKEAVRGRPAHQAGELPHVAPLVCDASARVRVRYPHCSGAPRPPQPGDDDGLYPRPQPGGPRCAQSRGYAVILRLG